MCHYNEEFGQKFPRINGTRYSHGLTRSGKIHYFVESNKTY